MKTLLQAQWVATMAGPLVREGGVVFDERRIIAAGVATALREEHPDAIVEDAGEAIILPGLINAHTHLELSDCQVIDHPLPGTPGRGQVVGSARPPLNCSDLSTSPPAAVRTSPELAKVRTTPDGTLAKGAVPGGRCADPTNFTSWLKKLILRTGIDPAGMAAAVGKAIEIGIAQCRKFGVTTVGDITKQCQLTRAILKDAPMRIVSYGEVQAMARRRDLLDERLAAALDETHVAGRLRVALSPHAPYSIEEGGYRKCLAIARERNLPLATHLAESADEAIFLSDHAGPFRDMWNGLGWWDEHVPKFSGGPIRFAQSIGLLDYPTLLAHVNYCDDDELAILAAGRASVVYNPRTHAHFGHPPHRWREMLRAGINVAVGTDSCASSPDLNIVEELRLLHRLAPEIPALALWELATTRAAKAIGQADAVGSVQAGKQPDFAVFSVRSHHPLTEVLEQGTLPTQAWIAGARV